MHRRPAVLVLAALVALGVGPAAAAPIAHREVLPNGLVLLVAERPAVPIVAVRVFLRAGAVFDPADRGGLANLTGALLTQGRRSTAAPRSTPPSSSWAAASRPAPAATA